MYNPITNTISIQMPEYFIPMEFVKLRDPYMSVGIAMMPYLRDIEV